MPRGVSNDGLVYVSDRGGKRVQVFTLAGKSLLIQVFIGRETQAPGVWQRHGPPRLRHSLPIRSSASCTSATAVRRGSWSSIARHYAILDSFGRWGSAPGDLRTLHHMAVRFEGQPVRCRGDAARPENRRDPEVSADFTLMAYGVPDWAEWK